ncbi:MULTISPECIES: cupin domain-containing protein [unclassified Streptomyces]|uniref:cupin domain-containing protein n=1 Tax=unclassified Streptomyces TaxID=2593676 RepID=UPI00380A8050
MKDSQDDKLETVLSGLSPPGSARAAEHLPLARGLVKDTLPSLGGNARLVQVRQILLPPGGTTGWHYHHGPLLIVVREGSLTHTFARDLSTELVQAGQAFVEAPGPAHGHIGTNLGTTPLVMYAIYFLPSPGSPLAEPIPAPGPQSDATPHTE